MCNCSVTTSALPTVPRYFITAGRCLLLSHCNLVQNVSPEDGAPAVLSNEVCSGGKKPTSLYTWRSGSPVCPSPSFPSASLLKQNCFQAAPLCSECCGGRDLTRNSCSLFILERLQRPTIGLECEIVLKLWGKPHSINFLQNICIGHVVDECTSGSFLLP